MRTLVGQAAVAGAVVVALGSIGSAWQAPAVAGTVAPDIPGVVRGGTRVEVVHTWDPSRGGEAPVGTPDGSLLFSEQDAGQIIKVATDGSVSTFLDTAPNQVLGLAYDLKGRLIAAYRGQPNGVVALSPAKSVLADSFEGQAFASPNDLVIDRKGGLYFTDNVSDKVTKGAPDRPKPAEGVYYVRPDGHSLRVTQVPARPNGIQLSPDGATLYVDAGNASAVVAFDVQPDGTVQNPREFARLSDPGTPGGADGMAVDAEGRLYVAANGGIKVFAATGGQLLGTIPTSIKPRNLAFAGADRKTLFIVTRGAVYKLAMQSEGVKGRAK